MATPVEVPKLGNTVEECILSKWRKHKGDRVSEGEIVADIETDKATFELPAPVSGTLLEVFFDEGALVPVFTNLFVIGEPGENIDPLRPQTPQASASAEAKIETSAAPEASNGLPAPPGAPPSAAFTPRAKRFAEEHRFHPPAIAGSGPGGRILEEDVRRAYYSPVVISRAAAGPVAEPAAPPAPSPAPRKAGIRDRIARRMRESLASTAQYTLHSSASAAGLLAARARVKSMSPPPEININDLVNYCTVLALLDVPALNSKYIDSQIVTHSEIHLGFACDTPRGLLVPVIRNAQALGIRDLASRAKELASQAGNGAISPDDLAGATFTVSNLGALGVESFTPLLNPPQVAILGIGAIALKPVRRNGNVEFEDTIGLSLTCDHQVIDGAPGARFLQTLRDKIVNVEALCSI